MQAELKVTAIISFALVGLQTLLFELVELAKVFFSSERSSPSRMLVDIQLVELTWRIRPHDLLRRWHLMPIPSIRRKMRRLLHFGNTSSVEVGPVVWTVVQRDLLAPRSPVPDILLMDLLLLLLGLLV